VPKLGGALAVTYEPLVSTDLRGNPHGAILDGALTSVTEGNLVHVIAWYDNEMGYSYRLTELCKIMSEKK